MADAMEDVSKPDVDKSEETVEEGAKTEGTVTDATTGDAGSVATDINVGECATEEPQAEEEKHVVDASATVVVTEDDELQESVTYADAAEDVAVEISEVETDENKELEVQTPDETVTVVTSGNVEEQSEADIVDAEVKTDATTDRVEHVTSKADKVTVPVEIPKAVEVSEETVVSSADTADAAATTKSETSDSGTAVNKTTQDVTKMAGNDELKFGVLIGLVHVGQFSNKDVVDSVLCLVSSTGSPCSVNSLGAISAACDNPQFC